jgi:hypothetical protein
VLGVAEPESAVDELVEHPVDTHGWPAGDLTDTPPRAPAGPAADDAPALEPHDAPDRERASSEQPGPTVGAAPADEPRSAGDPAQPREATTSEQTVSEQEGPHLASLPGLDRMRHLFGWKRE